MRKTFFTADHHFGHRNIIQFCQRPFDSIEEHNAHLIEAWNNIVSPGDTVWHLGDFAYRGDPISARKIFDKLNGIKHLIIGNHDRPAVKNLPWASVDKMADITVDGQRIVLCHYGLRVWNAMRYGTLHFYGHSHGNLPGNSQSCDVGVDVWDFAPANLEQIKARLKTLPGVFPENDGPEVTAEGLSL